MSRRSCAEDKEINAVRTDIPNSWCRNVVIRRPGCIASFTGAVRSPKYAQRWRRCPRRRKRFPQGGRSGVADPGVPTTSMITPPIRKKTCRMGRPPSSASHRGGHGRPRPNEATVRSRSGDSSTTWSTDVTPFRCSARAFGRRTGGRSMGGRDSVELIAPEVMGSPRNDHPDNAGVGPLSTDQLDADASPTQADAVRAHPETRRRPGVGRIGNPRSSSRANAITCRQQEWSRSASSTEASSMVDGRQIAAGDAAQRLCAGSCLTVFGSAGTTSTEPEGRGTAPISVRTRSIGSSARPSADARP